MPTGSLCSERNVIGTALAADHTLHRYQLKMIAVLSVTLKPSDSSKSGGMEFSSHHVLPPPLKRARNASTDASSAGYYSSPSMSGQNSPLAFSAISPSRNTAAITSVHRGDAGINPTAPCGSCNEWLKKIAESNPDFKVITFTDETCDFVYINSVQ